MRQARSQTQGSEAELIRACIDGRAEAFRTLVLRYQDRLYNAVYRMVGTEEDARDVTQETFLKAYENLERFRGAAGFYTWIFRIALNQVLSERRRRTRLRLVRSEADLGAPVASSQAGKLIDPPGAAMEKAETERAVGEALNSLDADHRVAVVLRDVEGLDYQAISEILDVPPGTVKSRIHRGRMMLREKLQGFMASEETG